MSELAYLGLAVLLSGTISTFVLMRQRQPSSLDAGVERFSRGLQALEKSHSQSRSTSRVSSLTPVKARSNSTAIGE